MQKSNIIRNLKDRSHLDLKYPKNETYYLSAASPERVRDLTKKNQRMAGFTNRRHTLLVLGKTDIRVVGAQCTTDYSVRAFVSF